MRTAFRTLLLTLHLALGLLLAGVVGLDSWTSLRTGWRKRLSPEKLASWWSRRLLAIFNIQVAVSGRGLAGPRVLVANHVSWLDIPVIASLEATRFVAKSEVRHWPLAGWLAMAAGTFFIRRGKGGSKPLLAKATPHLKAGGSFLFFPEGTTTAGNSVLKFHSRLFSAAIEAQCPVQPLALRYELTERGEALAPFVGDDDLVSHILRLLRADGLSVQLCYCAPLEPLALDRDALAQLAHAAIRRQVAVTAATFPQTEDEAAAEPAVIAA